MSQLFPEVIDATTLQPKLASSIYLPIAVEGQMDNAGSGTVGNLYTISRVDEASTFFGPASSLYSIVKAILDRGAGPVYAIPSKKGSTPALSDRQAAWQILESSEICRLRLTDSEVQADISGLAQSVSNAALLFHKQIAFVGLPAATTKANLISGANAIIAVGADPAKRTVFVGPGMYDSNGTVRGGSYVAAAVAAEVAKNSDPSNDLDLWPIQLSTGIENDSNGIPLLRHQVVTGVVVNDYEDLLQAGLSPLMNARLGATGAQTTHLRMVYKADTSFDALSTRIIIDQVFIDVRDYIYDAQFLRQGNTPTTRSKIKSGVEAVLGERNSWILPVTQADGTLGYNVSAVASSDQKQVIVGYEGVVVRGIQSVRVAPTLSIPA